MTQISQKTILSVLIRDGFKCRKCGAKCPEHLLIVDKVFKDNDGVEPGDLATYCSSCHNEFFSGAPIVDPVDEPEKRREQFMLLLENLKDKGAQRNEQAKQICEYFNSKLGGSKVTPQRRLDIERAVRVKDAVDVLDVLEAAYCYKVQIIDGVIAPRSYKAFMEAIPKYLSTSNLCDLNKELRIIRGGCEARLVGYDSSECYRYLLEYKMALEQARYSEPEIMKDLVDNVSQFDKATHTFSEWKNMIDNHRSQMVTSKICDDLNI